ncbi:outer membrane beta-barrel protein [Ichthyenterobacterium magnum]|uniref:Outer membrane protein with beta-barrel domain n=1 Tax=Ichthyenterobacterium magnum TaxID=1230530 RepID=A0A420DGE6_9FLAO|nr:outer membrane beta-barrel protein [Ichthyenterobacterium magnum]RKE92156.1 outer membrane protein with beta-barrel domain [Ichthyenterobacterium magnum]
MKILKKFHEYLFNKNDVSKNLVISTLILSLFCVSIYAQKGSSFGIKGGLNYNANGDYFQSIGDNAQNPDRNIGYHLGFFGKIGNQLYFRPELVYTSTKSDYNNDDFNMKKIDAPLLVGIKVLGPVSVFGGPSLQYILDTEFDGVDISNIDNDFSIGLNFGIGLSLNKIGIDLRYERGFSNNEANFIDNNLGTSVVSRIDTRPDQLILSLSVAL